MKQWKNAEVIELSLTKTNEDFWPSCKRDGGAWGDGKINGHGVYPWRKTCGNEETTGGNS